LRIDDPTGWLADARHVPSPHYDERPAHAGIELIVVHGISLPPGRFGGPWVERLFTGRLPPNAHPYFEHLRSVRVSSHLLIDRCGGLSQFVALHNRAWHAGVSRFGDRERCNDFAIGIELEGADTAPYTPAQYRQLVALLEALIAHYPGLTAARVVGHEHIAPGRKTDPGPTFDWGYLQTQLGVPQPLAQPLPTET